MLARTGKATMSDGAEGSFAGKATMSDGAEGTFGAKGSFAGQQFISK